LYDTRLRDLPMSWHNCWPGTGPIRALTRRRRRIYTPRSRCCSRRSRYLPLWVGLLRVERRRTPARYLLGLGDAPDSRGKRFRRRARDRLVDNVIAAMQESAEQRAGCRVDDHAFANSSGARKFALRWPSGSARVVKIFPLAAGDVRDLPNRTCAAVRAYGLFVGLVPARRCRSLHVAGGADRPIPGQTEPSPLRPRSAVSRHAASADVVSAGMAPNKQINGRLVVTQRRWCSGALGKPAVPGLLFPSITCCSACCSITVAGAVVRHRVRARRRLSWCRIDERIAGTIIGMSFSGPRCRGPTSFRL